MERFNRILKYKFNYQKSVPLVTFLDNIIEEVINHEEFLINENKTPFKPIPISQLKGKQKFNNIESKIKKFFYEDIFTDIMTYNSNENDSSDINKEFINEKNKKDFNFANSCYNNLFKKENKEKSINFENKKEISDNYVDNINKIENYEILTFL